MAQTDTDKPTRQRRSPSDIATAELKAAQLRVAVAKERVTKLDGELSKAKADVTRLQRLADYAARNPDLPENADDGTEIDEQHEPEDYADRLRAVKDVGGH